MVRIRGVEELDTITWPNGADIDPDILILGRVPASFGSPDRSRAV